MILGTYWYFGFPSELYRFDYFIFRKGDGGHAHNPAELIACFETKHPEKIVEELEKLINKYSDGILFIYQEAHIMKIEIGGYQLFDYDFLLSLEVEKILKNYSVQLINETVLTKAEFTKLHNTNTIKKNIHLHKPFLQIVGSELKKHHAENLKLRLDCNLPSEKKDAFIKELKQVAIEKNIDVFYYYEKDFEGKTNLMLFFTNGRQGLHFTNKKYIDTLSFENKIEQTISTYSAGYGHLNIADHYPQSGPKIEMIIEQDFIL